MDIAWLSSGEASGLQAAASIYASHNGTALMKLDFYGNDRHEVKFNDTGIFNLSKVAITDQLGCGQVEVMFSEPAAFQNCLVMTHLRHLADNDMLSDRSQREAEARSINISAEIFGTATRTSLTCLKGYIDWCNGDVDCSKNSPSSACGALLSNMDSQDSIIRDSSTLLPCITAMCNTIDTSVEADLNGPGVHCKNP